MTGKFISIEGIEGAGKSTQMSYIQNYLQQAGKNVVVTREPGGTALSEKIRELLLAPSALPMAVDTELLLMFAARAEHVDKVIKPAIERGDWVLSDRFVDATFAYQGGGRGISMNRIHQLADWTLQGLNTDLTIIFDLPVELGQQRVQQRKGQIDRFEQEKATFFEKVRSCYLDRANDDPDRMLVLDASQTIEQVQVQLSQQLQQLLDSAQ
jgi:dTMP kinase